MTHDEIIAEYIARMDAEIAGDRRDFHLPEMLSGRIVERIAEHYRGEGWRVKALLGRSYIELVEQEVA